MIEELERKSIGDEETAPPTAARGGLKALVRSLKDDAEAKEIQRALDGTNWNRRLAAVQLNISYKALLYKMRQFNLDTPRTRRSSSAPKDVTPVPASPAD